MGAAGPRALAAPAAPTADPYAQALRYTFDQPRGPLLAIEAQIHSATPEKLRAIEARLLAVLQSPEATSDAKDWVCRQLRYAGSEHSVGAIAPLLSDPRLASAARWALQGIPGRRVDQALRGAVERLPDNLKVGAVLTLGARRDRGSVPLLAPLAGDPNPRIEEAALYALGQIGGSEALAVVQSARVGPRLMNCRFHAMVCCAERIAAEGRPLEAAAACETVYRASRDAAVRVAALRGLAAAEPLRAAPVIAAALTAADQKLRLGAARLACEPAGVPALGPALACFSTLPADAQATILELAADHAALPAARAAAGSAREEVRLAALGAVARLGGAADAGLLLAAVDGSQGETRAAARQSLEALRGPEVLAALSAAAERGETPVRIEAIRALAARGAATAAPALARLADEPDPRIAAEAIRALAAVAGADALPALVDRLPRAGSQRGVLEEAIAAVCRRIEDRRRAVAPLLAATAGADAPTRCSLVRLLGGLPCEKSLEALRAVAGDADAAVAGEAVRSLAQWPDAAVVPDLLRAARAPRSSAQKVLALRGLVRLASAAGAAQERQTLAVLGEAFRLSDRAEEKRLVLGALASLRSTAALDLAVSAVGTAELEVEAAAAVARIAGNVRDSAPEAARAAVKKVLAECRAPAARQLGQEAWRLVNLGPNIAPQGTASSPDGLQKDGEAGGDQAAIDGNPNTYWDKEDNKPLYRLVVVFKQPEKIAALSILGYRHHFYAPKDFQVICDGKVIKTVENAQYDNNLLWIMLDPLTCQTVELRITGYYGGSPAVRELGIYRPPAEPDRP
jgi:HEAT repeat protein